MNVSISTRVNSIFIISFLILVVAVSIIAKVELTRISDHSQREIFNEKVTTIYNAIDRKYKRLQLTGMVETYEEDFKLQILQELRALHYTSESNEVYPFIMNKDRVVLLHPVLPMGDTSLSHSDFVVQISNKKNGEFYYTYKDGVRKWTQFQTFEPWQWTVGFTIPVAYKYQNVTSFLYTIIPIMVGIAIAIMLVITIMVKKLLHPISSLTNASIEIASGNLDKPITINGAGEFATLIRNFILMQESIKSKIEQIAESEENLRITLHSIGDGVIATDVEGKIVQINPIAEQLTGWSAAAAIGQAINEVFRISNSENEDIVNTVESILQTGSVTELPEYTILTNREGAIYRIADSAAPIRNDKKEVVGIVIVFHDVTEEYELKDQLQQSQKMDAIGQLAGGIAHDFNNMLAGIIGSADLLRVKETDEQRMKLLDLILSASGSAANLTKKLLDFSRKGKIESTPVKVHDAIFEAVSILQRSIDKKIRIVTELDAEVCTTIGDLSQLQNCFLNLGINAAHAMRDNGGSLIYRTSLYEADEVYCRSIPFDIKPGEYLKVEVEDTGCGIPLENIKKIFDPFYTTKEQGEGTGLGLAAVYGTVQQHHGSISVYSELNRGTAFHILLPVVHTTVEVKDSFLNVITGEGTILVIDDEDIIRILAQNMLEELGYKVILAVDGVDGIEVYKEHQDEIDMVILDVIMPNMDGRHCFKELKKINPDVKVVLSSGFTKDADIETLKKEGLCSFIHKPYSMAEISTTISSVLKRNGTNGAMKSE